LGISLPFIERRLYQCFPAPACAGWDSFHFFVNFVYLPPPSFCFSEAFFEPGQSAFSVVPYPVAPFTSAVISGFLKHYSFSFPSSWWAFFETLEGSFF